MEKNETTAHPFPPFLLAVYFNSQLIFQLNKESWDWVCDKSPQLSSFSCEVKIVSMLRRKLEGLVVSHGIVFWFYDTFLPLAMLRNLD